MIEALGCVARRTALPASALGTWRASVRLPERLLLFA
jgi:hypothetical protein